MEKTLKRKSLFIILLSVAVFCVLAIMTTNLGAVKAYAADNGEISYDYEYVPVESVELTTKNRSTTTLRPGDSIPLDIYITPWYAAKTVKSVSYSITSGAEYATVNSAGVLTALPSAPVGEVIKAIVTADGITSPECSFTIVKIPVTSITISANTTTISEGNSINLTSTVSPANASYKALSFAVLSGSQYASVDGNGKITVSGSVPNKNATFTVQATGDDNIKSNILSFSVYVPTKSLTLSSNNLTPYSTSTSGASVNLSTVVSQYATDNNPEFVINNGAEYVASIAGNVLTIKNNVKVSDAKISISAVQDDVYSNEVVLNIYVPATSITISASESTINKGNSLNINSTIFPNYASSKNLVYSIVSGSEYADINTSTGFVTVKSTVTNPNATFSVKATRDGVDSNILPFKIYIPVTNITLSATKTTLMSSSTSGDTATITANVDSGASSQPVFSIIAGSEYVTSFTNGILTIKSNIAINDAYVDVKAVCDDATANIRINISSVRVSSITFTAPASLNENSTHQLTAPSISPTNAVIQTFIYSITSGSTYATITDNGLITVKANLSVPNAVIKVKVASDGIYSAEKYISLIVPVKALSVTANKTSLSSSSTSGENATLTPTFNSGYSSQPTNTAITYYVESAAYVDSSVISSGTMLNSDSIKVKPGTPSGTQIKVYGISGGVQSSSIVITVTVPVETLSLTASSSTMLSYSTSANCGTVSFIPNFNSGKQAPTNNAITYNVESAVNIDAEAISGGTTLKGNSIKVKAGVASGTAIKVYAVSNGVTSASVTITVNVPVETVNISAGATELTSTSTNGGSAILTPAFNTGKQTPTNTAITYYVSNDSLSYVDASVISSGYILRSNTIKVKNGVTIPNGKIQVYAKAGDAISNTIIISIYVPIENLTFSQTSLDRGSSTTLTPTYNTNNSTPTYMAWGVVSISPSTVSINPANNVITLPANITYGTTITLKYKAKDISGNSYGTEFTKTFSVNAFTANDFTIAFSNEYWYEGSTRKTGYAINTSSPQLETGHFVDLSVSHITNGSISQYGLSAAIFSATSTYANYSGLTLSAKENASGSGTISCVILITDGSTSYSVTKSIAVFKRMSGSVTLYKTTLNSSKQTTLSYSTTWELSATHNTENGSKLLFEVQDGSAYSLTKDGLLTMKGSSLTATIVLKYNQLYNGQTFTYYSSNYCTWQIQYLPTDTDSGIASFLVKDGTIYSSTSVSKPSKTGQNFNGFYTESDGYGTQYYNSSVSLSRTTIDSNATKLYAYFTYLTYTVNFYTHYDDSYHFIETKTYSYGSTYSYPAPGVSGHTFSKWKLFPNDSAYTTSSTVSFSNLCSTQGGSVDLDAWYDKDSCVATGTLIKLADGSQKAVENLDGTELLLVWNLWTGKFDYAPMIFIDSEEIATNQVINLYFSDGTNVKVITEHGFWDYDLNKYVFLREDADSYLGHWFAKENLDESGKLFLSKVQLVDVVIEDEFTQAWSPVTFGHLCYFVNGMLSMPGATEGLINIFEVDPTTMQYDEIQMKLDILKYGLFTYEDFADVLPYEMYEAFGGAYLKVSISKGLIDMEGIYALIEYYANFLLQ